MLAPNQLSGRGSTRPQTQLNPCTPCWPRPAPQVSFLCRLMLLLENCSDPLAFMATLLQGTHRFLIKSTNIRMGCRCAVKSSACAVHRPERLCRSAQACGAGTRHTHVCAGMCAATL